MGISNKRDIRIILDELEKYKMEQTKYEDTSMQHYSSSSQSTYYSSSSQGDSQFGSQPASECNARTHTNSDSTSPHNDKTSSNYQETIMLQLRRTFC